MKTSPVTYPLINSSHTLNWCFAKRSRKLELDLEAFLGSVCLFCAWHSSKHTASCEQIRNDQCLCLQQGMHPPARTESPRMPLLFLDYERLLCRKKNPLLPTIKQNNIKVRSPYNFMNKSLSIKENTVEAQEQFMASG